MTVSKELPNSHPHLHRVNPRIRLRQPSVRDMHVAQFKTHVMPRAEDVHSEGGLVGEVHRVRAGGDVAVSEQRASRQFQIWRQLAVALEVPLQPDRVKAHSISRVGGLKDEEYRDGVYRIFEASTQKAGEMRAG